MKKFLFAILLTLLTSFSFTSCTIDNDIDWPQYPQVVQIFYGNWTPGQTNTTGQYVIGGYTTGQTRAAMTRAAVSQTYDDKFSLWSWTSDSTVMDNFHGIFGTDPNTGNPSWGYTENVKYFDNFVNEYSFIGVIPQKDSHVYDAVNHTVTVAADTFSVSSTDLNYKDDREILYATTTVEKANYATGASLAFNNLNSKIYLQFTSDDANTQIIDFSPVNPGSPAIPEQKDTVDTWISLNRSTNATGSATKTRVKTGENWGDYTNAYELPANLVAEIKSYYSIDNGTPGDYDLHMGASVWPSGTLKQLRVVKAIPAQYKLTVELYNTGVTMDFFDGFKYLKDNGYDIQPANTGGKPDVWNYVLLDAFVNGAAYTVVGFNYGAASSVPEYTINTTPGQPAIPATGKEGIIMLPATSANGTGTDAVLSSFPTSVNATISLNGVTWETTATGNEIIFAKPSGNVYTTAVQCPMTFFTFPASVANTSNLGYTIKFSYKYKNVNVYDARVFIPVDKCNWEAAKYYVYRIHISDRGNGKADPTDPTVDPTDPTIPTGSTNYQITVNSVSINGYTQGNIWIWDSTNGWQQQ